MVFYSYWWKKTGLWIQWRFCPFAWFFLWQEGVFYQTQWCTNLNMRKIICASLKLSVYLSPLIILCRLIPPWPTLVPKWDLSLRCGLEYATQQEVRRTLSAHLSCLSTLSITILTCFTSKQMFTWKQMFRELCYFQEFLMGVTPRGSK